MNFTHSLSQLSTENLNEQLTEAKAALELLSENPEKPVSVTAGYFFRDEEPELIFLMEHTINQEFVRNELTMICQNLELELKKR